MEKLSDRKRILRKRDILAVVAMIATVLSFVWSVVGQEIKNILYPVSNKTSITSSTANIIATSPTAHDEGICQLNKYGKHQVFYSQAFVAPPQLTFQNGEAVPNNFVLLEQGADSFTYEIKYAFIPPTQVRWNAIGRIR